MRYKLDNKQERENFLNRVTELISGGKEVDLKLVRKKRTVKQNAYFHKILTLFAIEFGLTVEEAKEYIKRRPDFMTYTKKGISFVKSTSDLNSKEMTDLIDSLRTHSSELGCYLPTPEELCENESEIENHIEQNQSFI